MLTTIFLTPSWLLDVASICGFSFFNL